MITINRLPMLTINTDILEKEQVSFGDDLQEKLERFVHQTDLFKYVLDDIKIMYNMDEIIIMANGFGRWDEDIHKEFCLKFNALLYCVETERKLTAKDNYFTVIYTYIPKFVKQKYNEEYKLDFKYILAKYL